MFVWKSQSCMTCYSPPALTNSDTFQLHPHSQHRVFSGHPSYWRRGQRTHIAVPRKRCVTTLTGAIRNNEQNGDPMPKTDTYLYGVTVLPSDSFVLLFVSDLQLAIRSNK